MNPNTILILPGCDDTNRGDQALIWETVSLAKDAGFDGRYYMIASNDSGQQSKTMGIKTLAYILPHPSMHSVSEVDNRTYDFQLKLRWAFSTILDLIIAIPMSNKVTRPIVSLLLKNDQKRTYTAFKNAKAAFVKGGGFLHDYGGIIELYKIFFFLYHINLAHSMSIPVYVMPNSFGPFSSRLSKLFVKNCLKKCVVVYSRDSISQNMLKKQCGIDSFLSSDLAMFLEKDSEFDSKERLNNLGICLYKGKMVGITVRPYRFPGKQNGEDLYLKYKEAICNLIIWLKENGYHPLLIEHVISKNYHEKDIVCINEIEESISEKGYNIDIVSLPDLNCKQMKSIYSELDYLIGTRFHSVIFALMENVPSIAITYGGNKGTGIMNDMDMSDYAVSIDDLDDTILIEKFKKLINNRERIVEYLTNYSKVLDNEYQQMIGTIGNRAE